MDLTILIVPVAALLILLCYAVSTLLGMKRKSVYPLLRVKRRDGTSLMMKVENGPVNHSV
jgi:hypothetical protein